MVYLRQIVGFRNECFCDKPMHQKSTATNIHHLVAAVYRNLTKHTPLNSLPPAVTFMYNSVISADLSLPTHTYSLTIDNYILPVLVVYLIELNHSSLSSWILGHSQQLRLTMSR